MNQILKDKLKLIKLKQNSLIFIEAVLITLITTMIIFSIIFLFISFINLNNFEIFFITLGLKIGLILFIIFLFLYAQKKSIGFPEICHRLDEVNDIEEEIFYNAYDFLEKPAPGNQIIQQRTIEKANGLINSIDYPFDFSYLKKWGIPLFCSILAIAGLFFINSDNAIKTWKIFRTKKPIAVQYQKHITLKPGNISLIRNSNLLIELDNVEPETKYTLWTGSNTQWRKEALLNGFKQFYNINSSFSYYISSEYGQSDTFMVTVVEEPFVQTLNILLQYPEYSRLKMEYKENSEGNFSCLSGTKIKMEITTPVSVISSQIGFSDKNFIDMKRTGKNQWEINFEPKQSLSYHFILKDQLKNESRPVYRNITLTQDLPPQIQITYPGKDTTLTQNMVFPISIYANDDYGLRNLKVYYQFNSQPVISQEIKKLIPQSIFNMDHYLDLEQFFMLPGDQITYWAEIEDNSPKSQKAQSKKYIIKYPSMEEIYEKAEKTEKKNETSLEKALEESKKIQKEFDEKRKELLKDKNINWEDKKEVEQVLKKQENLNQMVDKVADEYQKMIQNLENNQAVSKDILEKMQKIQELMQDINSEELQKTLEKLQDNLQNMNQDQLKKAMDNFKFSLEDYSDKLQKTLDLLESIKKEMAVQKSVEMLKEMEKMQSALNEKTDKSKDVSKLSDEQKAINEKLKNLEKQLNEMKEMMKSEKDKDIKEQLEDIQKDMEENELQKDMEDSADQLNKNQKSEAQKSQKSSLQKMAKLSAKLDKMKSSMSGEGMQEMMEAIQSTIRRLLLFSKMHEESNKKFSTDPYPIMPDMIANFEGIQLSLQKLYSQPQVLLFIGQKLFSDTGMTLNAYRELFTEVQEARVYNLKPIMSKIQKGINLMAFDLMQAMNNMQSGGGSGGGMQSMMQMLQQMGQEQMAMNMLTQQMMQQMMQGGNNQQSQQMRQQMQRLANEEQRLAENMKRMLQTNPDAQKHTQQINQLTEELEAISKQLKQGALNQELISRQNRIMSKLLDIQKSVQKKDHSQERKGETDRENWNSPEELKARFKEQQKMIEIQEELKKYPKEYQEIIKDYYKKLNTNE